MSARAIAARPWVRRRCASRAFTRRSSQLGLDVIDCGNVSGPPNPGLLTSNGYRNLAQVAAWNHEVHDAVYRELSERPPAHSAGRRSLPRASAPSRRSRAIAASPGRQLRVLWLDAHADFNTRELTPSGSLHGMPVACLCGFGPPELCRSAARRRPSARSGCARSASAASIRASGASCTSRSSTVFDMRYIDEMGMRKAMELALEDLDADTHLHVSFDVDFLDPEIAPGRRHHRAGGMSYREAQLCMEMIADTGLMGSLDIMELNPALDVRNKTAALAVDLVESLFGKSTLMRQASGLPGRPCRYLPLQALDA